MKGSTFIFPAFSINEAVVFFNDFFGDGKADTGPFVFFLGMKALEDGKDLLRILLVKADTIIGNADMAKIPFCRFRSIQVKPVNPPAVYGDHRLYVFP